MKVRQASWPDVLSRLFWDGWICWIVIWRWCAYVLWFRFFSLHNFLGCRCLCFERWFDGTSVSFDKQNLSGNIMHKKRWKDVIYYYCWTRPLQVSTFSCNPQDRIVLSWELLAWIPGRDRLILSFTNFITTPELSGPFYIGADIYHTQITEYSLGIILRNISKWAVFSLHRMSS